MKELDLHLKIKKCKFGVSQIDYLGMVLSPGLIEMDQTKLNGIRQWPTPKTMKDVRSLWVSQTSTGNSLGTIQT